MTQEEAWAVFCEETDAAVYRQNIDVATVNERYRDEHEAAVKRYQDAMRTIKLRALEIAGNKD